MRCKTLNHYLRSHHYYSIAAEGLGFDASLLSMLSMFETLPNVNTMMIPDLIILLCLSTACLRRFGADIASQ